MPDTPQPKSQSSRQPDQQTVPEMDLADFRKLAKSYFSVNCEPTNEEYKVKFIGPPYSEAEANCRSLIVSVHGRGKDGGSKLSPLVIRHILAKFEIPLDRFQESYDLSMKRVTPISPTPAAQHASPKAATTEAS